MNIFNNCIPFFWNYEITKKNSIMQEIIKKTNPIPLLSKLQTQKKTRKLYSFCKKNSADLSHYGNL